MHECPECGQACDCDGEDTWIGWTANVDCQHDCEEWGEDFDDNDWDDGEFYEEPALSFWDRVEWWLRDLLPFRCDQCRHWHIGHEYGVCCSAKCRDEWVPF